jgi:hypothetical protein
MSATMSAVTMGVGGMLGPSVSKFFGGVASPVLQNSLVQGTVGFGLGALAGGLGAALNGDNVWSGMAQGAAFGAAVGFSTGAYGGYRAAKAQGLDPWTGKAPPPPPSASAPPPPAPTPTPSQGGAGPVLKGQRGVERAIGELQEQGVTNIHTEVTFEVNGTRIRVDIVGEFNGEIRLYEVKNGPSAGFTPNQTIAFPQMNGELPIIPRGQNAFDAGFNPGTEVQGYVLQIIRY